MKSKFLKTLAALLAAVALVFPSNLPAQATDLIKTKSFTGFAFEKSTVTPAMKIQIKAWVKAAATSGFTLVSCTGYTGFNVNKREAAFLQTLAETRASNICNYIHSLKDVIAVNNTEGIPGDGKTATARKVTVRLIFPDGANNNGGGSGGGTGTVVIGVCDNSLNVTMRSRIANSEFYFASMTIKDIATTCRTKVLDIYLLDADGNQLAVSSANKITAASQTFAYTLFTPNQVVSNQIKQVAFEFRAP
jgi:hypothetical protein